MFAQLDVVGLAIRAGARKAIADRERYRACLELIESSAAEAEFVVSGASATRLLVGQPATDLQDLETYSYEFYASKPFDSARRLVNALHRLEPDGLTRFVSASRYGEVVVVRVGQRELVRVHGLPRHRGVPIIAMFRDFTQVPRFGGPALMCVGPEIRLMEAYAELCDPRKVSDWPRLREEEKTLRNLLGSRSEMVGLVGGAPKKKARKKNGGPAGEHRFLAAMRELGQRPGRTEVAGAPRLQLVSERGLAAEQETLDAMARREGLAVHFLTNSPALPNDPRFWRLTIYMTQPHRRAIADVFNLGSHEAVPVFEGLAHPLVVARLALVEYWTAQLLHRMKVIEAGPARQLAHVSLTRHAAAAAAAETAPPPEKFIGRIEDDMLAGKRAAAAGPKKFVPPYYAHS